MRKIAIKLLAAAALMASCLPLMWSCGDEGAPSKIWIELAKTSPTKNRATVNGGNKVVYDFVVQSNEGPIKSFKIMVTAQTDRVTLVDISPMVKKYNHEFTYEVPVFTKEPEQIIITVVAVDSDGNDFLHTCTLDVMLPGTAIEPGNGDNGGE